MILVTGATGTIGSHVVRLLTDQGVPFRAMSRRELPGGVRADFDDPASLARAVADVDTVEGETVGGWHLAAEEAIEASGLAWTMLRPPSFASNLLWHRALIQAGEPVPNLTGDSQQAVVDPRDVAAVAVAALTGPQLLTFADQAAILEDVLERPVKIVEMNALDRLPAGMATGIGWARTGGAAYVTAHVPQVLGRSAGTFEQWARDHREAFAATP